MKTFGQLKDISDSFLGKCKDIVNTKPWAVCIAMHEYTRNLYPEDPHIPFPANLCPTERLFSVAGELILFLEQAEKLGSYPASHKHIKKIDEVKGETGKVYGRLWSKFSFEEVIENTAKDLSKRLSSNGFSLSYFHGKNAIDVGCGSGRFSFVLKRLGCKTVIGVDYGEDGLEIANKMANQSQIQGISFRKVNVLNLPFEDETYDFVFCNGVLHHTENMEAGINEIIRIAKKQAKIWLYLYGDGGIFWYARKEMPKIMKSIPQEYTIAMLDMISMPSNRFIFCDNWYVPIERHSTDAEVREILRNLGMSKIQRLQKGCQTDLEFLSNNGGQVGRIMWGDGELRYIMEK
tara:strand:- start:401 stop:1444 length:1044 start_codon:yes stop_codon:yes gene_type:complete